MPLTATWTDEEDEQLRGLVEMYGAKRWSLIAAKLKTKGSKQCRRRWKNYLNAELKSGGWTGEEDRILMEGHRLYGNKWTEIAKMVGGRTDNAVKNRWAALCKRDSRGGGARRAGAGGGGGRGGRRPRASDSDAASDLEDMEDDSDDGKPAARRSSSFSSDSHERGSPPQHGREVSTASGRATRSMAAAATANTYGTRSSMPPPMGPSPGHYGAPAVITGAPVSLQPMSSSGRSSLLGRRPPSDTPPQDPLEASPLAKRRALNNFRELQNSGSLRDLHGSGSLRDLHGSGSLRELHGSGSIRESMLLGTPRTPRTPGLLAQLQEAAAQQQLQQQGFAMEWQRQRQEALRQRHTLLRHQHEHGEEAEDVDADVEAEELDEGEEGEDEEQEHHYGARHGHGGKVAPRKPPLTINIPNSAGADPQQQLHSSASVGPLGIEIRVLKDLLTPSEIQYARELNEMQLPLHINVDEEAPFSTSRAAAQNALGALVSPGSSGLGSGEFTDMLKWLQTGLTPRSAGTGPLGLGLGGTPTLGMNFVVRTGLTPRGIHGRGSPDGGLNSGHNSGSSSGNTPSSTERTASGTPNTRARRQVAVAAAVAAGVAGGSGGGGGCSAAQAQGQAQAQQQAQPGPVTTVTSGPFAGAELHAGHRQLLTKLITGAAGMDIPPPLHHGASSLESLRVEGKGLRLIPPSPSNQLFSPGSFLLSARRSNAAPQVCEQGAPAGAIVMTPHFSQQELQLLLEVLNSEDLAALPPPPVATQGAAVLQPQQA